MAETTNSGRVRIEAPEKLPTRGLSSIGYKQWKLALKIFMFQHEEYTEFYPGGKYPEWQALEDNPHRIVSLAADDIPGTDDAVNKRHLIKRRIQLETFLGVIAGKSDEGDFDDIIERSTSMDSIYKIHETRYHIQKKGRHFVRIDTIRFDKATMSDHYAFYSELRSCFRSNLLKKGDDVKYKNAKMQEDEKISPTTEVLLITIALERIDPRLPAEIDRIFGHRLQSGLTLMDICSEVFQYVPRALASLDREEVLCNAANVHESSTRLQEINLNDENSGDEYDDTPLELQAMSYKQRNFQTGSNQRNTRAIQFKPNRNKSTSFNKSQKYCKICKALDLPNFVFQSHNSDTCKNKLKLQQIVIGDENNDDD